jgi:hypothetical protein
MKSAGCLAILVCTFISSGLSGDDKRAKTEDGREVILKDDGTWYYVGAARKDKKASEIYQGKRGTFVLALVPGVWKKAEKTSNAVAEAEFRHKDGDAMAMVIAERLSIPLATLKEIVMRNIRKVDKEAKIVEEEKRTVNGNDVLFLTINAKVQGIPFTYMYYLYSGDAGTIQLLTFTGQNLFKEYKQDMEAFLNGFETVKRETAK